MQLVLRYLDTASIAYVLFVPAPEGSTVVPWHTRSVPRHLLISILFRAATKIGVGEDVLSRHGLQQCGQRASGWMRDDKVLLDRFVRTSTRATLQQRRHERRLPCNRACWTAARCLTDNLMVSVILFDKRREQRKVRCLKQKICSFARENAKLIFN